MSDSKNDVLDGKNYQYFGYGSNMSVGLLKLKKMNATDSQPAILKGHKLVFDVLSSSKTEPAYANVRASSGDDVHGVLHTLSGEDMKRMDALEGGGRSYKRSPCTVATYDGKSVDAWVYIYQSPTGREDAPSKRYMTALIQGAVEHKIQSSYIDGLRAIHTAPPLVLAITEAQEKLIQSKTFDAKDLVSSDPNVFITAVKGVVFDITNDTMPLEWKRMISGRDTTFGIATRVGLGEVTRVDQLQSVHHEYINASLMDRLSNPAVTILGHLPTRGDFNF